VAFATFCYCRPDLRGGHFDFAKRMIWQATDELDSESLPASARPPPLEAAMAPSGMSGVENDALAIYFLDPALARAFVNRWCIGCRIEV